jgi:hypothetical protein
MKAITKQITDVKELFLQMKDHAKKARRAWGAPAGSFANAPKSKGALGSVSEQS